MLIFPEGKGIAPNELILFVKNVYYSACDEYVVAWASFCDRDPINGRQVILIYHFLFWGVIVLYLLSLCETGTITE